MRDIKKSKKIHFIGIGGIMMSALAKYFLARGKKVGGSDRVASEITWELIKAGAMVRIGHKLDNIPKDVDLIVYTKAIDEKNIELKQARKHCLPLLSVFEALGQLAKEKFTVTISGMHGKSTTTSLIGLMLERAGLDPTVFVGTKIKEWQSNLRLGGSVYLVSEACEYKDNFLNYQPEVAVVTNLEAEHLDYFKNFSGVKKSFWKFMKGVKIDGAIILNSDDKNLINLIKKVKNRRVICYGIKNKKADFRAVKIKSGPGGSEFVLATKKLKAWQGLKIKLRIPGEFNIYNALAAIVCAAELKVKPEIVSKVLADFEGVWRRFEYRGAKNGIDYYDDYAHHPTEIRATLLAAREKFKGKNWWLIYQPHLYSRTKDFLTDFAKALNLAPNLIVAPIYPAREINKWGIGSSDLVNLINKKFKRQNKALALDGNNYGAAIKNNYAEIRKYLAKNVKKGEVVMTMGAGDVDRILNYELRIMN